MASRSSIAALLRRRSTAARLPASSVPLPSPSAAAAFPAASSSSPATRNILKEIVRGRGEAAGGPVRGYHALPASASREPLPTLLRGPRARATFSSSSAATAVSSKYDPVSTTYSMEAAIIRDLEERLDRCSRRIKTAQFVMIGLVVVNGVWYFKTYQYWKGRKREADKIHQDLERSSVVSTSWRRYIGSHDWDRSPESMH